MKLLAVVCLLAAGVSSQLSDENFKDIDLGKIVKLPFKTCVDLYSYSMICS